MSCNTKIIGNNSRVYLSDKTSGTLAPEDFEEVDLVSEVTPQTATTEMVDTPHLAQENDFTQRLPGSRTGGDITFTVAMQKDVTNQGLEDLMTYLISKQCVSVLITINGGINDTGVVGDLIVGAYVTGVNLNPINQNEPVTYSVTIAGNAMSESVVMPISFSIDSGSGSGSGS